MSNVSKDSRRYTRRSLLKSAASLGAGVAAFGALGMSGVRTVSAEVGRPARVKVLVDDVVEETADDFARGRMRGVDTLGQGGDAVLASDNAGEFISGTLTLPFPATHLGLHWKTTSISPEAFVVATRASQNGRSWTNWKTLDIEAIANHSALEQAVPVHGQHARVGPAHHRPERYEIFASLNPVDRADQVQYRVTFPAGESAELEGMTVTAINSVDGPQEELSTTDVHTNITLENEAGIQINLTTREAWGADESLRFDVDGNKLWPEMYVPAKKVFLHHTATSNNYSDGAAEVRAIYTYHAQTLGWGDIGYNVLVDRFGNIYEGRHGRGEGDPHQNERQPLSNDTVAGHVFAYNYGTTGIAAIGNSARGSWNRSWGGPGDAGYNAIEDAVAFECGRHYLVPTGSSNFLRSDRVWHAGSLTHCVGHRDADGDGGATACPGDRLYSFLDALRSNVASRLNGGPPPGGLTGVSDSDSLRFNWDSDHDAYRYFLEGWYKADGEHDIVYMTEYAELSNTYGENDPLAMEWKWHDIEQEFKDYSASGPGHYTIHIRAKSANYVYADHFTVLVDGASEDEPPQTGGITGTASDAESQNPISGATITVSGTDSDFSITTQTADDGSYIFEDIPVGDYAVTASATGYESQIKPASVADGAMVEVNFSLSLEDSSGEGEILDVHISTDKDNYSRHGEVVTITVSVTNESGQNITDAVVDVTVSTPNNRQYDFSGTTGASGDVVFHYETHPRDGSGTCTAEALATKNGDAGEGSTDFRIA